MIIEHWDDRRGAGLPVQPPVPLSDVEALLDRDPGRAAA